MSAAELRARSTSDVMKSEQMAVKPGNDGHDSFGSIGQEIGRELSFPRTGESSVQWLQFLHALDQQGSSKFSNGTKINSSIEGKEHELDLFNGLNSFPSDINAAEESIQSVRGSVLSTKGTKNTTQQIQTLNIPEAVVAFVQAAAKANGEPEKYLPGWPLLSPSKIQLQKCDKCPREFCSTINYRRHIRVHRRSLNIDKDSRKNRGYLESFWEKLSSDAAKDILSFKDVSIEEVTGSLVIKTLASWIRSSAVLQLPESYAKAGMALLELVQARPSSVPVSSQELFSAVDNASEKTFLCAGTALSMQKFVFDGETGKIALEMKNLIACASFMLEQNLVKAWVADKDAEALRCHKLLVEEEEAAHRRQAKLLERKRLKRLRQKEQKEKESIDNKDKSRASSPEVVESRSDSTEIPSRQSPSESCLTVQDVSGPGSLLLEYDGMPGHDVEACSREYKHAECSDQNFDYQLQLHSSQRLATELRLQLHTQDADQCVDHHLTSGEQQSVAPRWQPLHPARNSQTGFHSGQAPAFKAPFPVKHAAYSDLKPVPSTNGHKVWTRKVKPENKEVCASDSGADSKCHELEDEGKSNFCGDCEVLIGSINVKLGDDNEHQKDIVPFRENNFQQKVAKHDYKANEVNQPAVKLWKAVGRHQIEDPATVQIVKSDTKVDEFHTRASNHKLLDRCLASTTRDDCSWSCEDTKADGFHIKAGNHNLPEDICLASTTGDGCSENCKALSVVPESADLSRPRLFSSQAAEAFLAQRWKQAIAADHVTLALSPDTGTSGCLHSPEGNCTESAESSDYCVQMNLESAENRTHAGSSELSSVNVSKIKQVKPEKSYRMKYVPKQRDK